MINLRTYIILLLALCNISIRAEEQYGDYATRKYSVIPPSPEVASLMKYIDVPVSHFTYKRIERSGLYRQCRDRQSAILATHRKNIISIAVLGG